MKILIFVVLIAAVAAQSIEEKGKVNKRSTILTDAEVIPLRTTTVIHEPTLAKIGDYVQSVPTAVSHQSSTIVHDRANLATPIVAPAVKTRLAPLLTDYTLPLLRSYPASYHYPYPFYSYYY